MFFGATSFAAAPFAGVGVVNITVQPNGNRINVAVGDTNVLPRQTVTVNGTQLNLATTAGDVIVWNLIPPNANQIWIPIDPDNP